MWILDISTQYFNSTKSKRKLKIKACDIFSASISKSLSLHLMNRALTPPVIFNIMFRNILRSSCFRRFMGPQRTISSPYFTIISSTIRPHESVAVFDTQRERDDRSETRPAFCKFRMEIKVVAKLHDGVVSRSKTPRTYAFCLPLFPTFRRKNDSMPARTPQPRCASSKVLELTAIPACR